MLRTALEKHSQIHCLGEVFLPVHFEQTYIPQGRLRVGDILESIGHASDKNIVGFSILYNELFQSKYTTGLIDELSQRRFTVVHIVRDNLLRRFLSHKLALSTQMWTGKTPSPPKVRLSGIELLSDIKRNLNRAEKTRALLGHLPFLELSYESLTADFTGNFARVCEFLGARYEELQPQTVRQETRPLQEAIVNYRRLKLLFTMSKYRDFFDE
jgi:hypothetical protein